MDIRASKSHRLGVLCVMLALTACGLAGGFIPGSGKLPDCDEPPIADLTGNWFDTGTLTILTAGCHDARPNDTFAVCPLDWVFTQTGNDLDITVDDEYRLEGRLCADQLHLRGGWWLPVEDAGRCEYEDASADEVGIEAEGNVLTATDVEATGTLTVEGSCRAHYEVVFHKK